MIYVVRFTKEALEDLASLRKSELKAYEKAMLLIDDIRQHPTTGLGKPESLKYEGGNVFSRRITQKHRLVYRINDKSITVLVISAKGHYYDK